MFSTLVIASATAAAAAADASCPTGFTMLEKDVSAEGKLWLACEDLEQPGGAIVLVPSVGEPVWLPKTYEPYSQGTDDEYYLGLGKETVLKAKWDMLGQSILNDCDPKTKVGEYCEPTWAHVERAVPVMRYSQGNKNARSGGPQEWMCSPYGTETGVRTFVGSRSASVDATFSDHADDCTDNGFPRPQSYVMNLTNVANGEPSVKDFITYLNFTGMAEGLVGGVLPNVIFYFPVLNQNYTGFGASRYWTMIAAPVADMQGGREQDVWFRFQQLQCSGDKINEKCVLKGRAQYYDTYWYSSNPITDRWVRPDAMSNASGFYANLLAGMRYWDATLAAEQMMELSLPDTPSNNGTWLTMQARASIVRSMISREDTWHPRYGVSPGYGISLQDGFEDTFTSTATAALEFGTFPYAKGVIDNWLKYYIRKNGMTTYRAEELAQSGRMMTIFALYVSMTGDADFMVGHFDKAKALASWLVYRWNLSLEYPGDDARYGILPGGDEGDGYIAYFRSYGDRPFPAEQLEHMYSTSSNVYRGFLDIGRMWAEVGAKANRPDIVAHGNELLAIAPKLRATIQTSLNRTTFATNNPVAPTCVQTGADANLNPNKAKGSCSDGGFRSYPELFYSGVLTKQQTEDQYTVLSKSNNTDYYTRPMTLGCCGYNNKQVTYTAYGLPYGLLVHDMVERFLLHYFAMSAHTYTRGTWTTPEAAHPDRDVGSTDYVAAGVVTATTYLKWSLLFEEPDSRTVWLAKALPRDWLAPTADEVQVTNATTRYGRVSYTLKASIVQKRYTVQASVKLPATYATAPPPGGLKLRLRAPAGYAGEMKSVTVGGTPWTTVDAKAETVDFAASDLTAALIKQLEKVVVTFE